MIPDFSSHYYEADDDPFCNLSDLSLGEAEKVLAQIKRSGDRFASRPFALIVMVTDQAGSDCIGQRLYEDCSSGYYDGISAGELAGINITTKATITVKTK